MGFAQLYYTSCESGLSDFAGFQFNAATPGVPLQVLREVEALTSYEPPRSLGYRPSSAEIAACPVNLVYRCEPTTVLANVVFVGLDFSQRLGNYFAHALVGQTGADRFDRILPIELWGSPIWAGEPIAGRELPVLPTLPNLPHDELPDRSALPKDPTPTSHLISRAGVDRFLATNDRPDELTDLVTAAESAVLKHGRSIVIIEADSTAAAYWIAAISFLLPPSVARRMSFATYRHRPEYSSAHVVATLPESDFDLDESSFHSYVVFDSGSGRISEVPPDPAADLLVGAGAEGADRLWKRAATLVDDHTAELIEVTGITLAECYPLLVTAALLEGLEVTAPDLDALAEWLETNPDVLRPADRGALLSTFLDHPDLAAHHLNSLTDLARSAPAPAFEGSQQPDLQAQWRAGGERVLGPALVRAGGGDGLESPSVSPALTGSPALLDGVLAHLEAVAAVDPDAVIEVFARGLNDLIDDDETLPLPLRRAALLARCRRDLLNSTGPVPNQPVRDWLSRAIADPSRDREYLPTYLLLCRAIEDGTVPGPHAGVQAAVSAFLTVVRKLEETRAEPDEIKALSLRTLAAMYPQQRAPVQDLLRENLPGLIDELAGSPYLPDAVRNWPEPLVEAYVSTASQRLARMPAEINAAAPLFETWQTLRSRDDEVIAPALAEALRRGLRAWPPDLLDRLQEQLRHNDPQLEESFIRWRSQHLGGRFSRSLRRFTKRQTKTGTEPRP